MLCVILCCNECWLIVWYEKSMHCLCDRSLGSELDPRQLCEIFCIQYEKCGVALWSRAEQIDTEDSLVFVFGMRLWHEDRLRYENTRFFPCQDVSWVNINFVDLQQNVKIRSLTKPKYSKPQRDNSIFMAFRSSEKYQTRQKRERRWNEIRFFRNRWKFSFPFWVFLTSFRWIPKTKWRNALYSSYKVLPYLGVKALCQVSTQTDVSILDELRWSLGNPLVLAPALRT